LSLDAVLESESIWPASAWEEVEDVLLLLLDAWPEEALVVFESLSAGMVFTTRLFCIVDVTLQISLSNINHLQLPGKGRCNGRSIWYYPCNCLLLCNFTVLLLEDSLALLHLGSALLFSPAAPAFNDLFEEIEPFFLPLLGNALEGTVWRSAPTRKNT